MHSLHIKERHLCHRYNDFSDNVLPFKGMYYTEFNETLYLLAHYMAFKRCLIQLVKISSTFLYDPSSQSKVISKLRLKTETKFVLAFHS